MLKLQEDVSSRDLDLVHGVKLTSQLEAISGSRLNNLNYNVRKDIMNRRMRVFVGLGALTLALGFMLFGPSDMGDHPSLKGFFFGGILASAVLVARVIMRRRQQAADPEQETKTRD